MVTILLQQILDLLKGFFGDFVEWCNTMGDHMAAIHTNTDSLPDIKDNTNSIKNDTSSIKGMVSTITTNTNLIQSKVNTIKDTTNVISNNVSSIAASSGTAAAFAEDCATNTLNIDNRLVTIGSDTTQIRADSGNLAADVAEIKDTLGLYLYNTIVTEDAEGDIASCDTDLKDYLQEAKVTIPADAGGISNIFVVNQNTSESFAECFKGLLEGTHAFVDLGSLTWTYQSATNRFITSKTDQANYAVGDIPGYACSKYQPIAVMNSTQWNNFTGDKIITFISTNYIAIRDNDYNDAAVFKTSLNGVYLIYKLASPVTPTITQAQFESLCASLGIDYKDFSISFTSITDGAEIDLLSGIIKINTSPVTYDSITPIAIRTYKGVNNIYSDIGTTSVTYRETLKHYLKKQEA